MSEARSPFHELVLRVRAEGCIVVTVGELKDACVSTKVRGARGVFPTKGIEEFLKWAQIALGTEVAGNARRDRSILLYDDRQDGSVAKLVRAVKKLQAKNVQRSQMSDFARCLGEAAKCMTGLDA